MKSLQKEYCHIARIIAATLVAISLVTGASRLMADEVEAELIQIIDTSSFPCPDAAGIVYLPGEDVFLVSDSEVNEMAIFREIRSNVFKTDRYGTLLETFSTLSFSDEPTGISINPNNNHCFISDDTGTVSIYEVDPGGDNVCFTSDDSVTGLSLGIVDAEDVDYGLNSLFIVNGSANRVYRIQPGPNKVFDSVPGDDLITSFDTRSLGLIDPEGIVFNPADNTLFIASNRTELILQTTIDGVLLHTIDISALNADHPAGLALAPGSVEPSTTNLYMVTRGVDNGSDPYENDGKIYELKIPTIITSGNEAPVVSAGDGQSITLPDSVQLNGSVSDDGLPDNTLLSTWSKLSGPGEVSFTDPNDPQTTASLSTAGTYVLRLTGYDGELFSSDDVSIVGVSNETPGFSFLQSRVSASADDAEEYADGTMYITSSDLELVVNKSREQTVGVRFTDLSIPDNAVISKAYIQFKVDENSVNSAQILIHGESTANASGFVNTDYNISSRTKTNASVYWSPAVWDTVGVAGEEQRTPDLSSIVQEIISETGWSSGNAIAFIFSDSGTRVAEAYDGDQAGAPLLYLEYTTDASALGPVLTLSGANPMNLNLGDTFTDPGATAIDEKDGDISAFIQVDSNVNTAVAGNYTVTYTVSDSNNNSASLTRSVIVSAGTAELSILQSRVSASADDAEEYADGAMYITSSDLELVVNKGRQQTIGVRFSNLSIPDNAVISKAYIQFKVDERSVESAQILINGERTANAPGFANIGYNISSRTKTNASVPWSPAAWGTVGVAGEEQRTADLSPIVQEIISETGWNSGSAMVFILSGSGTRVAEAYNGDQAGAPLLYIEYHL